MLSEKLVLSNEHISGQKYSYELVWVWRSLSMTDEIDSLRQLFQDLNGLRCLPINVSALKNGDDNLKTKEVTLQQLH